MKFAAAPLSHVMLGWFLFIACAPAQPLIVVHSQESSAYGRVFDEVVDGIKSTYPGDVSRYRLQGRPFNRDDQDWLAHVRAAAFVALGRDAYGLLKQSTIDTPVLYGALPISPSQGAGVSLLLEPKFLFDGLLYLLPKTKRVHVVFSDKSAWLIELAKKQAQQMGLELHSYPADDYKQAARTYERLTPSLKRNEDSIWIPLDPITADEKYILPRLLEQAWRKKLALFAAKPALVKRGVLFSFFPDHRHIGESLGLQAKNLSKNPDSLPFTLLNKAKWVANLRTAKRIGIRLSQAQLERLALTFPD